MLLHSHKGHTEYVSAWSFPAISTVISLDSRVSGTRVFGHDGWTSLPKGARDIDLLMVGKRLTNESTQSSSSD